MLSSTSLKEGLQMLSSTSLKEGFSRVSYFSLRAIIKNIYTRPVPLKNKQYMLKSSEKHTKRPTRLAERTSYRFMRDDGTGTFEHGCFSWFPTAFGYLFGGTISLLCTWYIVLHCCFGRYVPLLLGLILLFHFFTRTSFMSLFIVRTWVGTSTNF